MRLEADADLLAFLYTAGRILFFSLPRLHQNVLKVPATYDIQEIQSSRLTEQQARYFASYDEKLAAMNYWPTCTYKVANYGHNLMRNYVNPAETSRCVVMIVELTANENGKQFATNTCLMSFHTWFTDDTLLTTRNMKLKSVLDLPPYQFVQECPRINNPEEMKRKHDARVSKMGCPVSPPSRAADIFKLLHADHERFSSYQLSQGCYKLLPDGSTYALTNKVFWRGIRDFLNPFAHHLPTEFIPAAIVAAFLPIIAALKLAPAVAAAAHSIGFSPAASANATMLVCYIIAGTLIGYTLERHTFVWTFLLTYLPLRILLGASWGLLPGSVIAELFAHYAAREKTERRAVLIPHASAKGDAAKARSASA